MNYNRSHQILRHSFCLICLYCLFSFDSFCQNKNGNENTSGDSLRVEQINIFGNRITKEKIIIRELSFREGTLIAKDNIEQYLEKETNRLRNTNLFVTQEIAFYPTTENNIVINVFLKERWYTFPIPLIELADRSFNEWWTNQNKDLSRIEYGLNFKRKNFRGRKEDLGLLLRFGFTKQLRLLYRVPFLDKKQSLGLTVRTSYSENNNISYNTIGNKLQNVEYDKNIMRRQFDFGLALTKRVGFYDFHNIDINYRNLKVADTVSYLNPEYFLNGQDLHRYFQLRYTYTHDYRDFSAYPLKGHILNISLEKTGLGIFDDVDLLIFKTSYAKYMDLGKNFYLGSSFSGKVSLPETQPYIHMRALGYRQDFIRGYDLYVIEGQHFGLTKNTLRFKFLDEKMDAGKFIPIDQFNVIPIEMYFKGYIDVGYVRNSTTNFYNEALSNKPLWGTGFGLDIVTFYNAVIRLEYSFNSRNENGFFLYFSSDL
ncbi:BamA/TamA family outer membrane protein [Chondrinema litorale]|uniref:BamA/TamA family outer membrane protein n=1 Tax=Chondrinema litorale TaxID=2994555 RepID=UPI00254318AC|nr:BamA/TamA family outer membrane protein [Chondrinema litorale]UZR92698.1 BamA/TamA family outer membrane protein [Chondrinema litorale]